MMQARSFRLSFYALALVALGLGSRRPGSPEFVTLYVGDVLWGSFFFVLFAIALPRTRPLVIWACACGTTELIELSQLYRAPWLDHLRATPLGGLLLGHAFLWSDVLSVAIGSSAAAVLFSRRESAIVLERGWTARAFGLDRVDGEGASDPDSRHHHGRNGHGR